MGTILRTVTAALAGLSAMAAQAPAAGSASATVLRLSHTCQCVAGDRRYAQGEIACIRGQRMQCGMSLNTSSWRVLEGNCQENRLSQRHSPRPGLAAFTPM